MKIEILEDEDLEPDQLVLRNIYKKAELDGDFLGIIPIWENNEQTICDMGYSPFSGRYTYCEVNYSELYQL